MKIQTKILIPLLIYVLMLFLVFSAFFIYQSRQKEQLLDASLELQQASALATELTLFYFKNKHNLVLYAHNSDERHLAYIDLMDESIDKKMSALKNKSLNDNGKKEFEYFLLNHKQVRNIRRQVIEAVSQQKQGAISAGLQAYDIKISQLEAQLADFSAHRFFDLKSSVNHFHKGNYLFEVLAGLVLSLSIVLLLIVMWFYRKSVIRPIYELTDSAWKVAQGYNEYKPKPTDRHDEIGQLTMACCVMTDHLVNANEELEQKVISRTQELERSNNDLEQFAYIASHDLQEPLRMIASYNQLLAKRYENELDEKAKKYIGYAVDGAQRMQSMIHGLLEYSKAGSDELTLKLTDLSEQLQLVLHDLQTKIEETGTQIQHMDMPSMVVNSQQISRVFQNLISNAIKFHNGQQPNIDISVNQQDKETHFCIKDNGVGIEADAAQRIFNLFERAHARQQFPGNGIGLAVSKRLVENHGGRIWLESTKGEGTAFYFSIPNDLEVTHHITSNGLGVGA